MSTKKRITGLDRLGQEFDEESYHFLEEHRPASWQLLSKP